MNKRTYSEPIITNSSRILRRVRGCLVINRKPEEQPLFWSWSAISKRHKLLIHDLTFAIRGGNYSMVEILLDFGADLSATSSDGLTAIHVAMYRKDSSIMDLFVRRCSDTYVGQRGWTRLHLAAINGDRESVRQQLEQGADKAARDQKGLTPLHWAAAQSHEEVVQLLLEMNTAIDAKDDEGMTALHHAASKDNVRIVRALLEKSAKRDVTDLHDWTPYMVAQMYAKDEICNTLSGGTETTTIAGTRAGLTPSCWVKAIGSSNITISKDGLTAISGKVEMLPILISPRTR